MIRVVLDTNIYISALMFGGKPGSVFELAMLRAFVTLISIPLLEELEEKLTLKFEVTPQDCAAVRERILRVADVVRPRRLLHVIEDDPDDDRVLECAVEGSADFIITGDRHLLKLGNYGASKILRAHEFLDLALPGLE